MDSFGVTEVVVAFMNDNVRGNPLDEMLCNCDITRHEVDNPKDFLLVSVVRTAAMLLCAKCNLHLGNKVWLHLLRSTRTVGD